MTIGTNVVPRLVSSCPVQRVRVRHLLVGIEMEPSLAALLLISRIPGENQALKSPVRKRHEILLKRKDAECVRDGIVRKLTVRPIRPNVELALLLIKMRDDPVLYELPIAKISKNR